MSKLDSHISFSFFSHILRFLYISLSHPFSTSFFTFFQLHFPDYCHILLFTTFITSSFLLFFLLSLNFFYFFSYTLSTSLPDHFHVQFITFISHSSVVSFLSHYFSNYFFHRFNFISRLLSRHNFHFSHDLTVLTFTSSFYFYFTSSQFPF